MSNTNEGDKIGDFRVTLPVPLKLNGRYECALTDIIYPYTFDNLTDKKEDDDFCENTIQMTFLLQSGEKKTARVEIPVGHYTSAEKLIQTIDKQLLEKMDRERGETAAKVERSSRLPLVYFDDVTHKCWLNVMPPAISLHFSRKLSYLLGVSRETRLKDNISGKHPVHVAKEFIYVYADCCEFQILSNVMCPLLRVIAASGEAGQNVEHNIVRPHYVAVRNSELTSIRIQLKSDQNEVIPFHSGKVCVVIHFRKCAFVD